MANKQRLQGMLSSAVVPPADTPPAQRQPAYPVGPAAQPDDALPVEVGALSARLQEIARHYVSARRRSGEALLDAARWLHEARTAAQHGEWGIFLQATGTSDDAAERLLNIYRRALDEPRFADAVARNWLSQSVAADLARPSTPSAALEAALAADAPPSRAEAQRLIRAARQGQNPHSADSDLAPPPSPDAGGLPREAQPRQNPHSADFAAPHESVESDPWVGGAESLRQLRGAAATLAALARRVEELPVGEATERALAEAEEAVLAIRRALGG